MIIVRFADHTIVGFEHEHEAKDFLQDLHERLRSFELALDPDKTRLIRFGRHAAKQRERRGEGKPETFDFLGFTPTSARDHASGALSSSGARRSRIACEPSSRRSRWSCASVCTTPSRKPGAWVKQMLQGHLNYFAVSGNHPSTWWFCNQVRWLWLKTLRRRSQKADLSWERFIRLVERFFPPIKTLHPLPCHRFDAKTRGRSPVR
ncbi:maturase [Bradyrhizobium sp. C-145]|uniref:maturase n=1 Tax=Bradyrhizobium sp. C-145 TaxID=574727 RepID=UPI0031FA1851